MSALNEAMRLFDECAPELEAVEEYHDYIRDKNQLKDVMQNYLASSGAYLLRNSFSKPGEFTVTVAFEGEKYHFNIRLEAGSYYFHQEEKFLRIKDLLSYYRRNPLPAREKPNIRLTLPIPNKNGARRIHPIMPRKTSTPAVPLPVVAETSGDSSESFTDLALRRLHGDAVDAPKPPPAAFPPSAAFIVDTNPFRSASPMRAASQATPTPPQPQPLAAATYLNDLFQAPSGGNVYFVENGALGGDRCDCGIPNAISQLSNGWTLHKSNEEQSLGWVFVQSPDQTQKNWWSQMPDVWLQSLTEDDMHKYEQVQQVAKRDQERMGAVR